MEKIKYNRKFKFVDDVYELSEEEKILLTKYALQRKSEEVHITSEWGRFENMPELSTEQIDEMAQSILDGMTLEQKINQMTAVSKIYDYPVVMKRYNDKPYLAGEDIELNIPPIKFTDGPTGIVMGESSTCFPVSIARGATWDIQLEEKVGEAMGIEGRALGANLFAGVCINIIRHPAWGRAQETYTEDTYLMGKMARALTRGAQKHMMACAKHFAANSIENSRFKVNVKLDERTHKEIYLQHFKECVDEGIASIMSAYNKVLGEYCGQNTYLLRKILKEEWGFTGFVISDFIWGARDGKKAATAGLDIEMPIEQVYGENLLKLIKDGEIDEAIINDSTKRILRQKIRFSFVGDKSLYKKENICNENHIKLAKEVALNSMVLLKNEDDILPIDLSKNKVIAVVGELAEKENTGDMKGSSRVYPPYVINPLEGIRKKFGNDIICTYCDGKNKDELLKIAKEADIVIAVVGLTGFDEGELMTSHSTIGGDRDNLSLKEHDINIIKSITSVNKNCIVCVEGGSAITMEEWKDEVKAIIMMWYAGMEGGNALADILAGDFNPCAKLPITIPRSPEQLPYFNKNADEIIYDYYHGYYLADKMYYDVAFPFGFGLSYTKYNYNNLSIDKPLVTEDDVVLVSVDVENIGNMAGDEIVQLYTGYKNSKVERHVKDLKGFEKIYLNPGEKKRIYIKLDIKRLAYYDEGIKDWVVEAGEYIIFVGPSSDEKTLNLITLTVKKISVIK